LALLTTPAAVALMVLAEPIVLTVFGAQWLPSVPILRALAAYAGVRALSASAGDVLKAIGRPGMLACLAAIRAVVLVPALILASAHGPAAVALMLGAITALSTVMTIVVVCSLSGISWGSVIDALRPSMGVAAVLSVALGAVLHATAPLSPPVQLVLASVLGLAAYLAAVRMLSPTTWREARRVVAERVARSRRPAGVMVEAQSP
jgi:O-antigen/teichoic acid export membrane protein